VSEIGQPGAGPAPNRHLIMATVTLASAIYSINLTVVAISLPQMQGGFSATRDQISWVVTAFILGQTAMIIFSSWLASRVGRKRLYVVSIAAFMGTSVMCGNAGSLEEEVFWRFLQGISGASLTPLSQTILIDVYPRDEYPRALGIWSIGSMVGPVIAPPIGGWITDLYGWPAVFYINVPIGLLALIGAILWVPRAQTVNTRRLDVFGFCALLIGLAALQLMMNRGARQDWLESTEIVVELMVFAIFIYLFVVQIMTSRNPFLPPRLFRTPNLGFGLCMNFANGLIAFLPLVMLPLMLQNVQGYPVELIGLLLAPRAIGVMTSSLVAGRLFAYVDARLLAALGLGCIAISHWVMGQWTLEVTTWDVVWTGMLQGLGAGMLWICLNYLTFAFVQPRERSDAVPLLYLSFNLAVSVGVAGAITLWTIGAQRAYSALVEAVSPYNRLFHSDLVPPGWDLRLPGGAAGIDAEIGRQSAMIGFADAQIAIALIALAIIPGLYLLRRPR
jgi:DHA2 family multidrug resistance protein